MTFWAYSPTLRRSLLQIKACTENPRWSFVHPRGYDEYFGRKIFDINADNEMSLHVLRFVNG